jgi:hypothetical protein
MSIWLLALFPFIAITLNDLLTDPHALLSSAEAEKTRLLGEVEYIRTLLKANISQVLAEVNTNERETDEILTAQEAARLLKVSLIFVYKYQVKLGGKKVGRNLRFRRRDVLACFEKIKAKAHKTY